ncbi:MAG: hypothetical protein Q9195_005369 [Heterodermia aff. obscurata]
MPAIYSPKLLFFPVQNDHIDIAIESFLHGLRSTFQAIPLLTGTIKAMPDGTGQLGTLAVTSPCRTVDEIVHIKDLRKCKKYNYSELREKGFPPMSLPMWDFIQLDFYSDSNPPAMHVQITLLEGGLVLAPCVHHNFIDGTGTAVILERWAASCRGETIVPEQISILWPGITPPEGHEKVTCEEFPEYMYGKKRHYTNRRLTSDKENQPSWLSRSRLASVMRNWLDKYLKPVLIKLFIYGLMKYRSLLYSTRMLSLSYADLARLKENVQTANEESHQQKNWISTLDALSALLFCCVTQSRHEANHHKTASKLQWLTPLTNLTRRLRHLLPTRSLSPSQPIRPQAPIAQFMTLVNVRKQCHLPPNYIRNMFLPCSIQTPLDELLPASTRTLATQARKLRARVQAFDGAYVERAIRMIRSVPDVSQIRISSGDDPLTMRSWREQGICTLDWGPHVGAKCERARICNFFHDGLVFVFPESEGAKMDGELELVLGLRREVMRELEGNELFNRFVRWR